MPENLRKSGLHWASLLGKQTRDPHFSRQVPNLRGDMQGSVRVLGVCPVLPAQWHVCEYLCEQGAHRQHEELGGGRCHRPDPWRSCKHFPCRLACEPACEPPGCCCWSPSNLKPPSQEFDVYKPSKPRGQQGSQPHSGCYLEQLTPGSGKGVYLGGAQQADATAFLKLRQTPPRAVQ